MMNLNTFHDREEIDRLLSEAARRKIRDLLVIRGDGGPELARLDPAAIGSRGSVATTPDLLSYILSHYGDTFTPGVAFNQYKPIDLERKRLDQKLAAGARFVVTQPVIGADERVLSLRSLEVPVIAEAWMSPRTDILGRSVRLAETSALLEEYDPEGNLVTLEGEFPDHPLYLSFLSLKGGWRARLPRLVRGDIPPST
jgi:methylenetetrahydrofolate reductase (NADPH)